MSQILHRADLSCSASQTLSYRETYQTNPNHLRYSKFLRRRLTLMMLWILRAPLMVRPAFIAVSLILLLASSAGAARINANREPVHAGAESASHRAHASSHSTAHTAKSKSRAGAAATKKRKTTASAKIKAKPTSRRVRRSTSARHKRVAVPSRRLRRARYSRQSRARFVPLATVPISRHEAQSDYSAGEDSSASATVATDGAPAPATGAATIDSAGNPLASPPADDVATPAVGQIAALKVPRVYGRYALRGTRDSLVRQNERVEQESLERIEDDVDLANRISSGALVRVPETAGLLVNPALPENRRYCRQWTADFLADLSRAHEAQFHKPLIVSSAVRTVEYQKHLMRVNHNAAEAEGDIVSPHLTGATIDIAKSGLSRREMQWMRDHLFAYQTAGVIDVEEEFRQRCFHITVYKNYAPASSPSQPHHEAVPQTVPPDPSTATVSDDTPSSNK